jgi:signal transduction histidine kinase
MSAVTENEVLRKIIKQLNKLFFQFTVFPNNSILFDYISDEIFDFFEVSHDTTIVNPRIVFSGKSDSEDLIRFDESLNHSIETVSEWKLDYKIFLPSKGEKWVRISANPKKNDSESITFIGILEDITQMKIDEENTKAYEERSHFANMATNVGVWDWNLVTNEVYYSPESLKILEIDNNDVALISNPEKWDERVHPDDREIYFKNIKEHFEQKTPYYETFHRILCNGKYKWILDRGKVILRDNGGEPLRIVGTHTDVSAQKEREENLLETLELVNNQKNKLLNFAHLVTHNLKNHTNNFKSLIEMNEDGLIENGEFLALIKTVSKDLSDSIDNLVDLVRVQNNSDTEKVELNVNDYLYKTFSVLTDDIHKNKIKIVNNISDQVTVKFNPAYLESVFLNLTSNAIKYSNPDVKGKIIFDYTENENYKIISVSDNGLGIDLNRHGNAIFGLYKTFHRHKDSSGIGLHITKNQIETLQGKIEVESEVNKGSTFKIYFKK